MLRWCCCCLLGDRRFDLEAVAVDGNGASNSMAVTAADDSIVADVLLFVIRVLDFRCRLRRH